MSTVELLRKEVKNYIDHADEKVVKMIHAMLETDAEEEWWNRMPDPVKEDVKAALKEADEGKLISHIEIQKRYKKWLAK